MAGILGVIAAIVLGESIHLSPPPSQLPGIAKNIGLNPNSDVLRLFLLCALPLLAGLALGRLRLWSRRPAASTRLSHPLFLVLSVALITCAAAAALGPPKMAVVGLLAAAIVVFAKRPLGRIFRPDRIGLVSTISATILAWTLLAAPAASHGWAPLKILPALFLVAIAEALWVGRGTLELGAGDFAFSCLAIPVALWGARPEWISWLAGLGALTSPLIGRIWTDRSERMISLRRRLATLVLLPGSFVAIAAGACLRLPPTADIFEDGHGLLPASEYFHGERPYVDIVPGHGLLSDGGFQAASLKLFGDDYKGIRRGTKAVGAFFWPVFYFVAFAATGSAALGFGALALTFLWFPQYMFFRVIASLATVALASAAVRTRSRGFWLASGAALPVAVLCSVDFGFYAAAGCAAALLASRGGPKASVRSWALGLGSGAVVLGIPLALMGTLPQFLVSTFVELRRLTPVYALGFHVGFREIGHWFSGWAFLSDPEAFFGFVVILSAIALAILAAHFGRLKPRARITAPIVVWFLAAVLSVIERHHVGYPAFALPLLILFFARWIVGWSGWASPRGVAGAALVGALLICARPPYLMLSLADALRTTHVPAGLSEVEQPLRARGALFPEAQRTVIRRIGDFLQSRHFGPSETWLDFANSPGLYYLFDRNCPIRYYEVPFYETEAAQDEVIRAIRGNADVRAVLMRTGLLSDAVDGILNEKRAPRVYEFIQRSFHPTYSEDGVQFWERNATYPAGLGR